MRFPTGVLFGRRQFPHHAAAMALNPGRSRDKPPKECAKMPRVPKVRTVGSTTLLVALVAAGLTGCGSNTTGASGQPQATTRPSATSTVPSVTPAVSVVKPTVPVGDRPSATPARPAGPAPDGDVDGDGRPDHLLLSPQGRLTVTYSAGGRDSVTLTSGSPSDLKLLGAVDADADGHAEVFARVVQGANAQSATVLRYVAGHLVQVTTGGDNAALNLGGGLTNQFSWSCDTRSGEIVQWQRRSGENDQTFQGEVRRYRFEGRTLVLTSRTPFSISGNEPVPGVPAQAGCGSLDVSL